MSLRLRLSLVLLIISGLGLFVTARSVLYDIWPQYLSSMEETLVDTAEILAAVVTVGANDQLDVSQLEAALTASAQRELSVQIYDKLKKSVSLSVYVCDKNGIVNYASHDASLVGRDYSRWNDVYLSLQGRYGARATRVDPNDSDSAILHVAAPIISAGVIVGTLTVVKSSDNVGVFVNAGREQIVTIAMVSAIVISVLILIVTLWVTKPIHTLEKYAQSMARGERIAVPKVAAPELRRMAVSLEYMRSALDGKQYVENYVQTLTHEFKSPLSVISGASELLKEPMSEEQRQRFIDNIANEVERLKNLVDRILLLAGLENKTQLESHEQINLVEMVERVAESVRGIAEQSAVKIVVEDPVKNSLIIAGDVFLLEMALRNILVNAIEFSSQDSEVRLAFSHDAMGIHCTCTDQGVGIPDFARERVFERFYSLQRPDGRKSSGLGLSVVKEIMLLHNADIQIEHSDERGTRMHLCFRLSKPA